jgi:signal transduction histidine kinase
MRTRFFRTTTVARLIEQLTRDPRGVREALAAALGDPTLAVAYWLPERGYVDRDGHELPPAGEGRVLTAIDHEGRRVGALVHATAVSETPELLDDASAAAALALENARLEVELRARLEALRASRARLVEAGDAERRRLGRDLHDGAQQRLVALMIELQLARERFTDDPAGARELVDSAFANAQAAVGELRDLASGIHPAVLSQRGLDAALESLASRAPVPVELESSLSDRLPIAVETAAYFVVAEALTNVAKYAEATHARVEVRRENGCAVVAIRDDGIGGAEAAGGSGLRGLGDRVGALDGTLEVSSPPGAGTLVRARIPL